MRCVFLIAALLAWLGGALSAQNPSSDYSLDKMTRGLFERLDKSELNSGILLQQSAMFVNPFRFDGLVLNDSNKMDASRFGKLYGLLRAASIGQPALPDPAIYLDELRRRPQHSDTILMAVLAMQFDYIRADAFDNGLLQWDADQKVISVPGQTGTPFETDSCFVFSALTQQATGKQLVYCLPEQFVFNNLGWQINDLQIDFDDGQGWRTVYPGDCINIQYSQSGEKLLRLQVSQNGRDWQAHSIVTVPEASVNDRYSAAPDEIIPLGGTTLNIFFDCEDHKLRKPLIVVEGFGGDLTDFNKMFDLLSATKPSGYNKFLDQWVDDEGYDLI